MHLPKLAPDSDIIRVRSYRPTDGTSMKLGIIESLFHCPELLDFRAILGVHLLEAKVGQQSFCSSDCSIFPDKSRSHHDLADLYL